ncbi:MAG TPA: ABC transporter permease [Herpetosiphonaceae bacterium]
MIPLLRRNSMRYLLRHPWQIGLAILGVALGVAVVVAIDLANGSARQSFSLATESIAGKATDQIVGGPGGLDGATYRRLRLELGLRDSAPVVEADLALPDQPGRSLKLLGVDPFAERPFRSYLAGAGDESFDFAALLTQPNTGVLAADTAAALGVAQGGTLAVRLKGVRHEITIVGLIQPADDLARRGAADLLLTDISTAQELLGWTDQLSRIDLILPAEGRDALLERIRPILPPGAALATPGARTAAFDQMTRSFEVNLQALSLLALIVGVFLIYNTMTFSVVQRRTLFGTLRALGVTRGEIFRLIAGEALLIGLVGAALGVALGIVLGRGLVRLVTQTINDLYFVVNVRGLALSPWPLLKGVLLGVFGTLAAASVPALEATLAPPRTVLRRSSVEERMRRLVPQTAGFGLALLAAGGALLALPSRSLVASFGALMAVVLGCALLTPAVTVGAMALLRPLFRRLFGVLGTMATRDVVATLSRTGVAIAALMVAVSVTVGAGTMIRSFRHTVVRWLDTTLQADVFVSSPGLTGNRTDVILQDEVVRRLLATPGIANASTYRSIEVAGPTGPTQLITLKLAPQSRRVFDWLEGGDTAWDAFGQGAVWLSEPYAYRSGLGLGDELTLETPAGPRAFPVGGVFYDYSSDQGTVMIDRATFDQHWQAPEITSLAIWAAPGVDVDQLVAALRAAGAGEQELQIRPNSALRAATLEIFDRTFAITGVLQLLATVVAFIGVLSALMALQLERMRELAVLRANGLTPGQLWTLVLSQTGLMGLTAGLLALPVGMILAVVLIFVINKRSFGWTLRLDLDPGLLLQALLVALVAALLAGLYPAWRMSRASPALALREE